MDESELKLAKRDEVLLSCAGVQTVAGRIRVRWESESAATPMGQLAYFIEFLTLSVTIEIICRIDNRFAWPGALDCRRNSNFHAPAARRNSVGCRPGGFKKISAFR